MTFGEVLKKVRKDYKISLNELSKKAEISPSYLSKLENNTDKIPSNEIIIKIIYALRIHKKNSLSRAEWHTEQDDLIELFFNNDSISLSKEELDDISFEYTTYALSKSNVEYLKALEKQQSELNNKISFNKTNGSLEILDKPHFDLEWLLTQKKYAIFYGNNHEMKDIGSLRYNERFLYKEINEEDSKILNAMIKAYFNMKYKKINNPEEYYGIRDEDIEEFKKILLHDNLYKED